MNGAPVGSGSRWMQVTVVGCSVLTFLTSLAIGSYVVWFQLFSVTADRTDHLAAVATYAVGVLALLTGLPALLGLRTPLGWCLLVMVLLGALTLLAVTQWQAAQTLPVDPTTTSTWWIGALALVLCPWTLVPAIFGAVALLGGLRLDPG